jgi:endothelin-converting enzyme
VSVAHRRAPPISDLERARSDILQLDPIATYNPVPFTNVTDALPQIKFGDYFAAFTPRNFPERVIVTYPAYVPALSQILDETPADVLEGYLVIRAALTLAPFLGLKTEAWQAQRSLLETLQGIKKGAVGDRSEYCIGRVEVPRFRFDKRICC